MHKSAKGFHLIEMLSAMAILSILVSLCLPIYSQYIVQAKRLEAASMLSKLSAAMEKFHLEQNTYEGATLARLNFPITIANNHYQLHIQTTANDYTLLAKPIGKQAEKDTACGGLILQADGRKEVTGTGNVNECW